MIEPNRGEVAASAAQPNAPVAVAIPPIASGDSNEKKKIHDDNGFVTLISSDGHEFYIKRAHAFVSPTIRAMIDGAPEFIGDASPNVVNFKGIQSHTLQKMCHNFAYKVRYTDTSDVIPEFPIPIDHAVDILMAADFLQC